MCRCWALLTDWAESVKIKCRVSLIHPMEAIELQWE